MRRCGFLVIHAGNRPPVVAAAVRSGCCGAGGDTRVADELRCLSARTTTLKCCTLDGEFRCRTGTSHRLHLSRDCRRPAHVGPRTTHVAPDLTINQYDAASPGGLPPSIAQRPNVRVCRCRRHGTPRLHRLSGQHLAERRDVHTSLFPSAAYRTANAGHDFARRFLTGSNGNYNSAKYI